MSLRRHSIRVAPSPASLVRLVIVLGFWFLVCLFARLLGRFAKRPVAPRAQASRVVRMADTLARNTAQFASLALWALVGWMGIWALVVLAVVAAD